MAYTDLSATFVYKGLLTYQQMDGLGENDKYFKDGITITSNMVTMPSQSSARAYRGTSNQLNLVHDTWEKVQLNAESYDVVGEFDSTTNYRFTATVAGYYQINAQVKWINEIDDRAYEIAIYKNGSSVAMARAHKAPGSATGTFAMFVSDIVSLAATDYVELYAKSYAAVDTVDIQFGEDDTFMSIRLLG